MFQLSPNYYRQNGCHNCAFVSVLRSQATGPSYFCVHDGVQPPAPPSSGPFDEERDAAYTEARMDWEAGRDVEAEGMCENYLYG